jgi:RNA ligase
MRIGQMFDMELFDACVSEGHVNIQTHPIFPELSIANYSQTAVWEGVWNEVTLACRGLIFNNTTDEIIARPFKKFFNLGQEGAAQFGMQDKLVAIDKMDGSLGILYKNSYGHYEIATRGSFASEQAKMASKIYYLKYHGTWRPRVGVTYLFMVTQKTLFLLAL